MPDSTQPTIPPAGDAQKAEKYLTWLCNLIGQDKLVAVHTDLKKFDPNTMQDHYQMILQNFVIEVSHSRNPNNDKDSYIMLFNNMREIAAGTAQKVILAYIPLTEKQFKSFKFSADDQKERFIKQEEERRFKQVMAPVDHVLNSLSGPMEQQAQPTFVEKMPENTNPIDRPTLLPAQA